MSSSTVPSRPSQALRQRRESQRPSLAKTSTGKFGTMENGTAPKEEPRPYIQTTQDVLRRFKGQVPSLIVHLHPTHFRINTSQETLAYSSPIRALLEHIRKQTVPHDMLEELYAAGVPFYDNCLIVEVHDHKTGGVAPQSNPNNPPDGSKSEPFSIHNYNNFITPSPHVPYPTKPKANQPQDPQGKPPTAGTEAVKEDKDTDKENMPAPGQPFSQKQPVKERIYTTVLFPTPQQHNVDIKLLATTPLPDMQTYRRNQSANRTASTPTMAHPPTPLTSVPPTPSFANMRSPKRQKMVLDEFNVHEFEAEIINATAPRLYLEPTHNLEESVALIDAMTPSLFKNDPPTRKTRKRTTAELAADEAEAAETQKFMLAGDEWQAAKTANASAGDENQSSMRGGAANFQTFSRFKTLESIKMHHEETERRKKEEEARQAQIKRQAQAAQAEAEQKKRTEMERQAEHNRAMLAHRQQELLQQQQQQQLHSQQEALRAATQAQQMSNNQTAQFNQPPQTQPQHSSPVIRQQTPMAASSPVLNVHTSHPMGGVPMVSTSSSHGAGSPARPPSAVSHHPGVPMARNMSQQQVGQAVSRNGTPQMVQGTPVMNSAMPARNMTPQPRMNPQGSPGAGMQGTPVMMQTPQNQNLTPEQMAMIRRRQQMMQMQAQAAQQQGMNGSPNPQMSQEQVAMLRAQQQIASHGVPQGQNPAAYQQALARQILQQQQQNQNNQMASASPQNPQQMRPSVSQPGFNVPNQMNLQNADSATLRAQYMNRKQQLVQRYQAQGQQIPIQHMQQMKALENAVRQAEAREQAAGGQQPGGMNQQPMQGMNMGGQQNPQAAQIQYQRMLQQQRQQHMAQQQQMMNQMRNQMQGQMGGMGMNNMNMMNGGMQGSPMAGMNMNNMGNMNNMNMQNMGAMGNMNMQMSMQQMQQMQMLQRQAQAQAQAQARGQRPQGDGGIEWSGI